MADDKKNEGEEAEELTPEELEAKAKKKKKILTGGGVLGLVAAGWIASMMAVPKVEELPHFEGPFVAPLSESSIQVNLRTSGARIFLVTDLNVKYKAYDEAYLAARVADPVYQSDLTNVLLTIIASKTPEEALETSLILLEELEEAIGPILFPIHIGDALLPTDGDSESGLQLGQSVDRSSLRGAHHAHVLQIDAVQKTISLDKGELLHLDVTSLDAEFVGEIQVGSHGRIEQVQKAKWLVQ